MSKKKNTLKDLDEFLKQQAATLVEPTALREKITPAQDVTPAAPVADPPVSSPAPVTAPVAADTILKALHDLREQSGDELFRFKLYDLLIQTLEQQPVSTAADKMLINTALYLKSGERWKEVIADYWRHKR